MATTTATILIGKSHQNHGGICPTHQIFLSENNRPALTLYKLQHTQPVTIWIPTVEHMLEDALLMVGLLVVRNPALVAAAESFYNSTNERLEINELIPEAKRRQMYEICQNLESANKAVVTVFQGSTLLNQLAILSSYRLDLEVCAPLECGELSS